MGLNSTPSGERTHIAFFGRRNVGKSSLVNAITDQHLSVVSPVKGTTTDPVRKAMELLPVGPVVIIDTPGIDDEGDLGQLRVERTRAILDEADVAVLVVDSTVGLLPEDHQLLNLFREKGLPCLTVFNKCDLLDTVPQSADAELYVSAQTGFQVRECKEHIAALAVPKETARPLVSDLISAGDMVVLVTPIDESAPKGRLILPQQQTIRDILDSGAMCTVVQPEQLKQALASLSHKPKLVITDSQAFGPVNRDTPPDILLTSFSILFARYKGDLSTVIKGAFQLDRLQDGDRVLISEGCTHHRQCKDIGTVKLPGWLKNYTKKDLLLEFTSGGQFPDDLSGYSLVIHCGGCMLTPREMQNRLSRANAAQVPMTNYGIAIAQMHGILRRSLSPFPDLMNL